MTSYVPYILLLPIAGAAFNILAGRALPRRAVEAVAVFAVFGSCVFAVMALYGMTGPVDVMLFDWISFGSFTAPFTARLDAISATMAVMVTGVSTLIHIYSVGYMADDDGYVRFFALMNLFVFSMLTLVLAGNLPLMYLGWEGVGFCSYGLIGFWYQDTEKATAGRKAFIVTRVGDVAFGVAVIWLYQLTGQTAIAAINQSAQVIPAATVTAIGLLLLFGATGKSAQLPLTVWLPDAMAGPTPVSALIHAATMVTAGVYLLMRMYPLISLSGTAMAAIAAVGALTAFYAATSALGQTDIKRVLAYSTISQIGYMVMGVGAGAVAGPLFHLFSHAFFKALLFLGAGYVIKAMHEEQDIFKMGGLMYRTPLVFVCFLSGALALAAVPGTSGFFSKDEILSAAFNNGSAFYTCIWAIGELTAFITTVYALRLVYLVFTGESKKTPAHVSGLMDYTLIPLALLSLAGGAINAPESWGGGTKLSEALISQGLAPRQFEGGSFGLQALAVLITVAGFATVHYLYAVNPKLREDMAARQAGLMAFLKDGWGLDRLYHAAFVAPYTAASRFLWRDFDEGLIDDSLDNLALATAKVGTWMRSSVTGRMSTYLVSVFLGAAALLAFFAIR